MKKNLRLEKRSCKQHVKMLKDLVKTFFLADIVRSLTNVDLVCATRRIFAKVS